MKNKSTLTLFTFLVACCIGFAVSAQQNKSSNDFTIGIVKPSNRSNLEKEHVHILELKNNSRQISEFEINIVTEDCSVEKIYNSLNAKSINKELSNIKAQMFLNDLSGKEISGAIVKVNPNESISIFVKTIQNTNAVLDSRNCTNVLATKLSNNQAKGSKNKISESVTIKTFVRNPNNKGH
jgi:hypothetical protein